MFRFTTASCNAHNTNRQCFSGGMALATMKKLIKIIAMSVISLPVIAASEKNAPTPSILKTVGTIEIQFDVNRVVSPTPIPNTDNPQSQRAYLPICPPGSTYVSGVNPNLIELDQGPNYLYCNCICKGNCNGLAGITSPGGITPIYTATVTCKATIQGWFDNSVFAQTGTSSGNLPNVTAPHQYYYCQSGNCGNNPLPSQLNYSVPVGGYANTTKIDFESCAILSNHICGAPDPTSPSRAAGNIP